MVTKDRLREWYLEAVRLNPHADGELKAAMRAHERVPAFIDNLEMQITQAQLLRVRQGKKPFRAETIKSLVYDMADVFLSSVTSEARARYESDLARAAREAEAQRLSDMDQTLDGKPSGEFSEMGLEINEQVEGEEA